MQLPQGPSRAIGKPRTSLLGLANELLRARAKILQTKEGVMSLHAYGSSDKQRFLARMADGWLPKGKRVYQACRRSQAFGKGSKAM